MNIPDDMIFEIYKWLKITDKRNFNVCKHYYKITRKQFKIDEENFTAFENTSDRIKYPRQYCCEKFFVELCHDQYFHLIPEIYMCNEFLIAGLGYYGGVEILKTKKIPYNVDHLCYYAAENGQVEVLKWVKSLTELHTQTYFYAIRNGQVDTVCYLYENGCPFSINCCDDAIEWDQLEILKFIHKHGCALTVWSYGKALKTGNIEIIQYVKEHY